MTGVDEAPSRIEPCLLDEVGPALLDLVAALAGEAQALSVRLHPASAAGLADLVRVMNCYYSNLIEGHNTKPRDIERALVEQFDPSDARRALQLEARAHIRVQREIDRRFAAGTLPEPASTAFLLSLHREFYADAPEAMLLIAGDGHQVRMVPGEFRRTPEHEVAVGRHLPPSPAAVDAFMDHFEQRYRFAPLGAGQRILAMAAAHHRLNFIHPFLDGNGRVSRLMSHAMALHAGIGAHGLWSVSRGLARGIESRGEYRQMLDLADTPRQGDLDGRGALSRRALSAFTVWFLTVCLDQVRFMAGLFALDSLADRLHRYAARRGWRDEAGGVLRQVLLQGALPRGEVPRISGLAERTARSLLAILLADGILGSDTPKGPVSLRFPQHAAEVLFPDLFPEI